MHRNAELIEKFYRAFQRRDGAAMTSCYHPQVHFSDPGARLYGSSGGPRE